MRLRVHQKKSKPTSLSLMQPPAATRARFTTTPAYFGTFDSTSIVIVTSPSGPAPRNTFVFTTSPLRRNAESSCAASVFARNAAVPFSVD